MHGAPLLLAEATIIGLAAWRGGHLLAKEDGPGDCFEHMRRLMGVPKTGEINGFLPKLITCVWCNTIWLAAGVWGLLALDQQAATAVALIAAGAGVAAMLHAVAERLER